MVIRLLGTIAGLVILAFFVGFNLENKCNVSLLFKTFNDVPVFITIMISFAVGILFTLPLVFSSKIKSAKKAKEKNIEPKKTRKKEKNKESILIEEREETQVTIQPTDQEADSGTPV